MGIFHTVALAALLVASPGWSEAFTTPTYSIGARTPTSTLTPTLRTTNISNNNNRNGLVCPGATADGPCDAPSDVEATLLEDARPLREAIVTNIRGEMVALGDAMTQTTVSEKTFDTSVVVFLRHMGCPYCWTYANDWQKVRPQLEQNGINGPIFVSIGDRDKMETFLNKNPSIDPSAMFVDGYDFAAYEVAGFGKFTDTDSETAKQVKMAAPNLDLGQWMGYFGAVGKVSPIPKNMKFGEIPEGVLRLGGTFVVKGDNILYQWSDRLPGDHPSIPDVLTVALDAN